MFQERLQSHIEVIKQEEVTEEDVFEPDWQVDEEEPEAPEEEPEAPEEEPEAPEEEKEAEALTPRWNPLDFLRMLAGRYENIRLGELSFSVRANHRSKRVWMGVYIGALIPMGSASGGVDPAYKAVDLKQEWHITLFYSTLDQRVWAEAEAMGRLIAKAEKKGKQFVESWQKRTKHLDIEGFAAPHPLSTSEYAWSDIAPFDSGRCTRITELLLQLSAQVICDVPFLKAWQKKDSFHISVYKPRMTKLLDELFKADVEPAGPSGGDHPA